MMQYQIFTEDRDDGGFWARMDELVHGLSPDEKAEQARWQEVENRIALGEEAVVEHGFDELEEVLDLWSGRDGDAVKRAALGGVTNREGVEGFTVSRSGERIAYGNGRRWAIQDDGGLQEISSSGFAARSRDLTDAGEGEVGREVWLIGRQ